MFCSAPFQRSQGEKQTFAPLGLRGLERSAFPNVPASAVPASVR